MFLALLRDKQTAKLHRVDAGKLYSILFVVLQKKSGIVIFHGQLLTFFLRAQMHGKRSVLLFYDINWKLRENSFLTMQPLTLTQPVSEAFVLKKSQQTQCFQDLFLYYTITIDQGPSETILAPVYLNKGPRLKDNCASYSHSVLLSHWCTLKPYA